MDDTKRGGGVQVAVSCWIGMKWSSSSTQRSELDGIACLLAFGVGGMALRTSGDYDAECALRSLSHDA